MGVWTLQQETTFVLERKPKDDRRLSSLDAWYAAIR